MTNKNGARLPSAARLREVAAGILAVSIAAIGLAGCYPAGATGPGSGSLAATGGTTTEAIPLVRRGEILAVPAEINGAARLDFLIDSGSTDVVLPVDVVRAMLRSGMLSEGDFIGHAGYRLADGSVLVSPRFILRQVRVGGRAVSNVTASVGEIQGLPLLGESFLSRFSSWAIDNDRHALILTGS